jgi:hypothetical protein
VDAVECDANDAGRKTLEQLSVKNAWGRRLAVDSSIASSVWRTGSARAGRGDVVLRLAGPRD